MDVTHVCCEDRGCEEPPEVEPLGRLQRRKEAGGAEERFAARRVWTVWKGEGVE